jgi:phosphate transport system protein
MSTQQSHIVSAYDSELKNITDTLSRMGRLVLVQFSEAVAAIKNRDNDLAAKAFEADNEIDALENGLNEQAIRILALRQPMAGDLRLIVGSLKIARDIERMGDYAANMAKRARRTLNNTTALPVTAAFVEATQVVEPVLLLVIEAFEQNDTAKAEAVIASDDAIDEAYMNLTRALIAHMQKNPHDIEICTQLLFMSKNLERIGDRATNVAETIQFILHGADLAPIRKKKVLSPPAV